MLIPLQFCFLQALVDHLCPSKAISLVASCEC
jgi:hypothetical protein